MPFSDIVESIGGSSSEAGCFDSELGLVSPYSVRLLTRLVNGLNANGMLHFLPRRACVLCVCKAPSTLRRKWLCLEAKKQLIKRRCIYTYNFCILDFAFEG